MRLAEVVQVLVRHGFADLVQRAKLHEGLPTKILRGLHVLETPSAPRETIGQRMRAALTELGPTFVKFGQIMSTRPDIVGNELAQELSVLQDHVKALPFDSMRETLRDEFGQDAEDLFESIDTTPVAAASLSQVYRARLKGGQEVAVKIQRPGIEKVIESDLRLMALIAEWVAEYVEESNWLDPVGVVEEFARSIRRELDFEIEARVIQKFRHNFADYEGTFVPMTYPEVSSRRVVTMDWVDGVRVDAFEQYAERGCDQPTVAQVGAEAICRQIFDFHLFHADPHPGNIFITRDNRIAFLDYGMVGHIERTDAAVLADLLYAVFREDSPGCVNALVMLALGEPKDRQALEHEIASFIAFEGQAIVAGGRVTQGIERMVEILRKHHLQLAPRFSLLLKALATIEAVSHQLDPNMDMIPVIQPHVERLVRARYSMFHILADAQEGIAALLRVGKRLPAEIENFFRLVRKGTLSVHMTHEGLDRLSANLDRASNRLAFAVIAGSLIIGSSFLIRTDTMPHLGLVGFVIAGVLGIALLVSILRSKNY